MTEMLEYVIKSVLCMLILFGFYRFLLESENMHVFKRFYLLAAVIFSLILPLITISYTVEASSFTEQPLIIPSGKVAFDSKDTGIDWWAVAGFIALTIYLCGVLFFAVRFFRNLFNISREINSNEKKPEFPYIFVLIRRKLVPHSFLRYIFLGKSDFENDNISSAVLEHEKAHVDQKHSWDLLFIEFLHIIFWFNPLFTELKKAIRLNHEFLADRKVLKGKTSPVEYSQLLFSYNSANHHSSLYSPINNSLIKKRIIMISKNFSKHRFFTRLGFLVPVLALCIYLFNNDIVAKTIEKPVMENNTPSTLLLQQTPKIHIKISGENIYLNGNEVKLKNFGKEIDKLTKDFTAEEISEMDFSVQTRNPEEGLIDQLENEFQKTKFAEITGLTILPPPPPPAPETVDLAPPPPPASSHDRMPPPSPPSENGEAVPHPPAPQAEYEKHVAEVDAKRTREMERVHIQHEREMMAAHRQELAEMRKSLKEDRDMTEDEREKMRKDIERERAQLREKMEESRMKQREMTERHRAMERKQMEMERAQMRVPQPPPPPNPLEGINKIEETGGTIYYNGKEISAEKARELVRNNDNLNIRLTRSDDKPGKMEISDN